MTFRLTVGLCLFVVTAVATFAQDAPVSDVFMGTEGTQNEPPQVVAPFELHESDDSLSFPSKERDLQVFSRSRVQTNAIWTGDPSIFAKLGTATSSSSFNVTDSNDLSVFTVQGDGKSIFRKDQPGWMAVEINNGNPGSFSASSARVLRFNEGTANKAAIINYGSASAPGATDGLLIWNYVNAPMLFGTNGVERMRIHGDGNVSIGPAYNQAKLLVLGSSDSLPSIKAQQRSLVETTPPGGSPQQNDYGVISESLTTVTNGVTSNGSSVGGFFGGYHFGGETANPAGGLLPTTFGGRFFSGIYSGKEGSVTNAYGVHVQVMQGNGTVANGYGLFLADVAGTNDYGVYQAGTNDDNVFMGRLGIGTSTPANALHVIIPDGAVNVPLKVETTGVDSITGVSLKNDARNMHIRVDGTDADKLKVFDATASASRLTITTTGDVGIGTDSPGAKLHVSGSVVVTNGNITALGGVIGAVYQDVAEWVPATTDMEPGTVVVLNHERNNEVMPSHSAYDTSVAGVVSAQPGVLLGVAGDSKEQIATTGRVKVRVDATRAPIRVGDLLVTSDISGTAMRSEPMDINGRRFHQPGTIIGKALEPLDSGTGEILVLLSMQ